MAGQLAKMVREKHPGAYDDLSDDQLEKAVIAKYPGVYDDLLTPEPSQSQSSALSRFAANAGEVLNPIAIAKGVYQTVRHPIDTAAAIYDAQGQQFDKATQAAREGRYSEALGHGAASLLPVIGPQAAAIGEQAGTGDIAGAAGKIVGNAIAWNAPKIASKVLPKSVGVGARVTPEAELAKWGLDQGIPVDAASATANPIPRAVQQIATKTSIDGSAIGTKAARARATALATIGEQLAAKGYAPAATRETAGAAARAGVEATIRGFDDTANASYDAIRALEQKAGPTNVTTGTVRTKATVNTGAVDAAGQPITQATTVTKPVTEAITAPVDLAPVQSSLKPLLERLNRKKELVVVLQGAEARAATSLDRLVNGKDFASLADVDAALGDLKSMARGAEMPELRSAGQGAAAFAVNKLDKAVMDAAAKLGPDAVDALKAGRQATVQKYAAAEVLDALKSEPVRTANAATAPKDAAIAHLRDLQKYAPDALPQVGKAVLSEMLGEATKDGGFASTARLASQWEKLGPETKRLLFKNADHVKDLDRFWSLAKKMGENPNPSGSAFVGGLLAQGYLLTDPLTLASYQVGGATLAKLLNSPTITKALVEGASIPIKAKAAASARYARLTNLIDRATKSSANQATTPQASTAP